MKSEKEILEAVELIRRAVSLPHEYGLSRVDRGNLMLVAAALVWVLKEFPEVAALERELLEVLRHAEHRRTTRG